jgi:hypothetical protein
LRPKVPSDCHGRHEIAECVPNQIPKCLSERDELSAIALGSKLGPVLHLDTPELIGFDILIWIDRHTSAFEQDYLNGKDTRADGNAFHGVFTKGLWHRPSWRTRGGRLARAR